MASGRRPGRRAGGWVMGGAVVALLVACSSAGAKQRAAEETVHRFFAALPSGDCRVLGPMLATGGSARPCEDVVKDLQEHGFALVGISGSQVDGRDPEAVMVSARLEQQGVARDEPYLLRVERQEGGWRLRF